ncbi:MAG TPA: hypothetical protein VIL65_01855 [Beijerinckiaceae bacterium]|jgi:hypothetical protein
MAHLYFHCTHADAAHRDARGAIVADLAEARDRAVAAAQAVMTHASGLSDFRDWRILVADEDGAERLVVPFAFVKRPVH